MNCNPRIVAKRARFLKELARTGNVCEAARLSCLGRAWLYEYRKRDPSFDAAWERALDVAADALESEARRRAMEGTWEPVFHQGDIVGGVRRYSDSLLMFLLKGNKPDKFAERRQVSGPGGGPQEHRITGDFFDRLMTKVDGTTRGLPGPHELPPPEDECPNAR
jgi:hypothetical protein